MEQECKVSIIVPVYNVERYIRDCLESLIKQTIDSYEVIVINDGSPDSSQDIIDEYVAKYPDIVKSYIKENGGLGSARNYGLQYAKGEYIGFVDSDDWVDAKMFESMYNMALNSDYDIVLCDFTEIYDGWKSGWTAKGYRGKSKTPTKIDFMLSCMNPATACNKLIKKELFYICKFQECWYEDIATTPILLSYAENIGYLQLPLYYYRQQDQSITHTKRNVKSLDVIMAWNNAFNMCKEELKSEVLYSIYTSIITFIRFKSEYADNYLDYVKKYKDIFVKNIYIKNEIRDGMLENIFEKRLIPKKIHYFWFGNNKKSELILKCIESWKTYAEDYEIIEWNENNCDINECDYVKEAYEKRKWAFVADYFRIKKVYEHGGIYLDTDVELTNSIDILRLNNAFFAFESKKHINAATFGAIPKFPLLKNWLDTYNNDHLIKNDGSLDTSNTIVIRLTNLLIKNYNISLNGKTQILKDDIKIYAPNILTLNMFDGENMVQHHYDASWWDAKAGITSYKYEVLKDYFSNDYDLNCVDNSGEIEILKNQITAYENSTCWKLTKPIRILGDFIQKIKH